MQGKQLNVLLSILEFDKQKSKKREASGRGSEKSHV